MNNTLKSAIESDIKSVMSIPIVSEMLDVICKTTGMGFAAVARVTDSKWVACSIADNINFGLEVGGELDLKTTICDEIRQHGQIVVFDNVLEDPLYEDHHTPKLYGLQSYISVPIILKNGEFFGTLCAIDAKPNKINSREVISMFKFYAELLSFHLNSIKKLEHAESQLIEEKEIANLREQFIAVLGHDLRNPVGAVRNIAQLLQSGAIDDNTIKRFSTVLLNSSHRMNGLIENLMDFARGRLGKGITLSTANEDLAPALNHVIDELQIIWPDRVIYSDISLQETITCDSKRIAQLFSNLLGNALSHGDATAPVFIDAKITDGQFILNVTNSGLPIPSDLVNSLFQPFSRADHQAESDGLGLGLYIASEISRAHNGELIVHSDEARTTFTLKMAI